MSFANAKQALQAKTTIIETVVSALPVARETDQAPMQLERGQTGSLPARCERRSTPTQPGLRAFLLRQNLEGHHRNRFSLSRVESGEISVRCRLCSLP